MNRTSHTVSKLFSFIHERSPSTQQLRVTGLDLETKDLIRTKDVVGATTDIFRQPNVNIFTIGLESFEASMGPEGPAVRELISKHALVKYPKHRRQKFSSEAFNAIFPGGAKDFFQLRKEIMSTPGGVLKESELSVLLNNLLGEGQKHIVIGHNIAFDLSVIGGVEGFKGVSRNTIFLNTLDLARTMFGEDMGYSAGRPQSYTLENLRGLMEAAAGVVPDLKAERAVARVDERHTGIHVKRLLPAIDYYTPAVVEAVKPYFKTAYEELGLEELLASHRADVDARVAVAVLRAAQEKAARDPEAKKRFEDYLRRIGAIPSEFVSAEVALRDKYDKARVADFMSADVIYKNESLLKSLEEQGSALLENLTGVRVYKGEAGVRELTDVVASRFGDDLASSFSDVAQKLVERVSDGVFVLRSEPDRPVSLAFGKMGDPRTFQHLPLQSTDLLESPLLHYKGRFYTASNLAFETEEGLKRLTFSEAFYKVLSGLLDQFTLSTENIEWSLRNLIRKTVRTPFYTEPTGEVGRVVTEMGTVKPAILKNLISSVRLIGGISGLSSMALHGMVSYVGTEIPGVIESTNPRIVNAKRRLIDALQKRNKAIAARRPEDLSAARREMVEATEEISNILKEDRDLAAGYVFGKPEFFTEQGAPKIVTHTDLLGVSPETRAYEKFRYAGRTTGADRSREFFEFLSLTGDATPGPAYITEFARREMRSGGILSRRLYTNTVEAAITFFQFSDPYTEARVFGDSGIVATERGSHLLREHQPIGTIKIPRARTTALENLKVLFPQIEELTRLEPYQDITGEKSLLLKKEGLTKAQLKALDDLIKTVPISGGKNVLKRVVESKAGARVRSITLGDEIVLQLDTPHTATPATQNILIGPHGETRVMSLLNLGDDLKLGHYEGYSHFLASSSILTDTKAAAEFLLRHRVALARKTGLLDEMVEFFNKQEGASGVFKVVDSKIPGFSGEIKTLVIPDGTDIRTVFRFMDQWQKHVRSRLPDILDALNFRDKTASVGSQELAYLAFIEGYKGIPVDVRKALGVLKNVPEKAVKTATTFYTDMLLRTTSSIDVASSLYSDVSVSALKLKTISGDPSHPLTRIAAPLLWKQTRHRLRGNRIEPPPSLKFLASVLSGQKPDLSKKALLRPIGKGQFQLAEKFGDLEAGSIFHAPPTYVKEAEGLPLSDLRGTLYDPRLTGKAVIELPKPINIGGIQTAEGTSGRVVSTKYIPIPSAGLLGFRGGRAKYGRISRAGPLAIALSALARSGDLEEVSGVAGSSERLRVKERLAKAYDVFFRGGGLGGYLREGAKVRLPGFAARVSQLPFYLAGQSPPPIQEALSGFITDKALDEYLSKRYGLDHFKAKKLKQVIQQRGYLYTFLSADPSQTSEHNILVKLRVLRDTKRLEARRGAAEVMLDPYAYSLIDRDLDQDRVSVILSDLLGERDLKESRFKDWADYEEHMEAFFERQAERLETDYKSRYLAKLLHGGPLDDPREFVDRVEEEILSGRMDQTTGDLILRSLGAKAAASEPFTAIRSTKNILLDIIHAKDSDELYERLIRSGADKDRLTQEVIDTLLEITKGEGTSAGILVRAYHQAGVAKSGRAISAMEQLTDSIVATLRSASESTIIDKEAMIEDTTYIFQRFYSQLENLGVEIKYGSAAATLGGSDAVAAGRLMGKVFGRIFYAQAAAFRGKDYNSYVQFLERRSREGRTVEAMESILGAPEVGRAQVDLEIAADTAEQMAADSATSVPKAHKTLLEAGRDIYTKLEGHWNKIIIGAAALGGLAFVSSALGDSGEDEEELPRPPINTFGGSPIPPTPSLSPPSDRGPQSLPLLPTRPVARISPEHPAPLPSFQRTRVAGDIPTPFFPAGAASASIRDERDPLSKTLIANRMKRIATSDFVWD